MSEFDFEKNIIRHKDGRKLVVFVSGRADRKNSIVFIPGTGAYSGTYKTFLKVFSKHYNVISVDLTGHGHTFKENGESTRGIFTGDQLVEDVLAAVEFASRRFGGNVGLFGTSQGGEIAARAMLRTSLVKASVLQGIFDTAVSGGVNFKQRLGTRLPTFLLKLIIGKKFDFLKMLDWQGDLYKGAGYGSTFVTDFVKENGKNPDGEIGEKAIKKSLEDRFQDDYCLNFYPTESYSSLLKYNWYQGLPPEKTKPDPLAAYQGAVMVMTGEYDRSVTPDFIRSVGNRLTSPLKEVVVVKNAYHQLPLHSTKEFLDSVLPFYQRHLG